MAFFRRKRKGRIRQEPMRKRLLLRGASCFSGLGGSAAAVAVSAGGCAAGAAEAVSLIWSARETGPASGRWLTTTCLGPAEGLSRALGSSATWAAPHRHRGEWRMDRLLLWPGAFHPRSAAGEGALSGACFLAGKGGGPGDGELPGRNRQAAAADGLAS